MALAERLVTQDVDQIVAGEEHQGDQNLPCDAGLP
jgi:hypothetical protein